MIYEKVKQLADEKGLAISALENEAQLSNGAISKWRTSSPSIDNLLRVAKVLDVDINELVEGVNA